MVRPSLEYYNEYQYLPKHLRPKYNVFKNTKLTIKYYDGWKKNLTEKKLIDFEIYKSCVLNYKDLKINELVEFKMFKAFLLYNLTYKEKLYIVEKLLSIKKKSNKFYILVKWNGYENTTWEPIEVLYRDAPEMLYQFLHDKIAHK